MNGHSEQPAHSAAGRTRRAASATSEHRDDDHDDPGRGQARGRSRAGDRARGGRAGPGAGGPARREARAAAGRCRSVAAAVRRGRSESARRGGTSVAGCGISRPLRLPAAWTRRAAAGVVALDTSDDPGWQVVWPVGSAASGSQSGRRRSRPLGLERRGTRVRASTSSVAGEGVSSRVGARSALPHRVVDDRHQLGGRRRAGAVRVTRASARRRRSRRRADVSDRCSCRRS